MRTLPTSNQVESGQRPVPVKQETGNGEGGREGGRTGTVVSVMEHGNVPFDL